MRETVFDLTELVRSLQRTEGNRDCFRRGMKECGETECAWRPYCLEEEAPGKRPVGEARETSNRLSQERGR